jgi:hypothetical protein
MPIDLVNRFAVTSLQSIFNWSGKVISIATNSPILLNRMAKLAPQSDEARGGQIDCSWRIVTEPDEDDGSESDGLSSRYVGNEGMSFVTIGPHSFLAYDEQARKGVSFVSEKFVRDPGLFDEAFLPGFASLLQMGKE